MAATGFPESPPTKVGPSIADYLGSFHSALAAVAALQYRERTGEGQFIDISLQDCVWAITGPEYAGFYFATGEEPLRLGNGQCQAVPFNVYPAKDGYVAIAIVTVGQFESFLRVIGREDLIGVEKYATIAERANYRDEVDALVEEWIKTQSVEEILNKFRKAHLPASSVSSISEAANDPQLLERGMITEVEQLISGKVQVTGSAFKLSKTPGDTTVPAPFLGEHNYEVYSGVLGYGEEEITKLTELVIV